MEGLRRRLSTLFLEFCETPAFNPEAAFGTRVTHKAACSSDTGDGGVTSCDPVAAAAAVAAARAGGRGAGVAAEMFMFAEAERAAARAAPVGPGADLIRAW